VGLVASLGIRLKATRERRGWSREALAYYSGMSAAAIAQIEAGRRKDIRMSSLLALAEALEVTVDHLIGNRTGGPPALLEHQAFIYGSEEEFLAGAGPFIREGVERKEGPLVVTTAAHIALLRRDLGERAGDVEFVDSARWYATPRAAFDGYRDAINRRRAEGLAWMRMIGEPVWSGSSDEAIRQWIRYESMLNLALAAEPLTLLCPYDERSLPAKVVEAARQTHPTLMQPAGGVPSGAYKGPEDLLVEIHDATGGLATLYREP
jgi:transcriptional regulator with XRE-family HTH domain